MTNTNAIGANALLRYPEIGWLPVTIIGHHAKTVQVRTESGALLETVRAGGAGRRRE